MAAQTDAMHATDDSPIDCLVHKLRVRDRVTEEEAAILGAAVDRVEQVPGGRTLVVPDRPLNESMLIVSGYAARYKDLSDGQRQITDIHLSGDFTDLHAFVLKRLEHHIGALTPLTVAFFPHAALKRISEEQPHLLRMLWLSTLIDASVQRERLLSLGRRTAVARIAHLLCELYVRLELVKKVDGNSFAFPVTQLDLADATGLTSVHVNRMLRQLRNEGLVTFRNGIVEIHDLPRLEKVAEFDRTYLFLKSEPR